MHDDVGESIVDDVGMSIVIPPLTEKELDAQIRELAQLLGWTTYHTWRSLHSEAGYPDLTLVRPPRVIFAELKTDRGKLSWSQRNWLELLGQCPGIEVYTWRPADWPAIERTLR